MNFYFYLFFLNYFSYEIKRFYLSAKIIWLKIQLLISNMIEQKSQWEMVDEVEIMKCEGQTLRDLHSCLN